MQVRYQSWLTAALVLLPNARLAAQLDYRNLDDGRPIETTDAQPLDHRALELRLPYRFQSGDGSSSLHLFSPSLSAGIVSGLELTAGLSGLATSNGEFALAQVRGQFTAALTTESNWWPALAVTGAIAIPTDRIAGRGSSGSAGLLATRTFGYTRLHLNGGLGIGQQQRLGLVEGTPRWSAGAAIDRTLFRQSLLLAAELRATQSAEGGGTGVITAIGLRWQWSPVLVLDAGTTLRLSPGGAPPFALTLGLSREWSWASRGGVQ